MSGLTQDSILCLMGPSATGKTALSIALAKRFPIEIISVDSALIYRGMDIGSAKPTLSERAGIVHHLIDIRDPRERYSAAAFCDDVRALLPEIQSRGNIPLLVGGTMLYFHALFNGLAEMPESSDAIKAQLEQDCERNGLAALHDELSKVDPTSAARIHPNDPQRIMRALEVYRLTGAPLSEFHQSQTRSPIDATFRKVALVPTDRLRLHELIERRFHQMLATGFIDEVKALHARGDLTLDLPAIRAVGYRQVWLYLEGQYSEQDMIERSIIATRQLAKRQMTWIRSMSDVTVLDAYADQIETQLQAALALG